MNCRKKFGGIDVFSLNQGHLGWKERYLSAYFERLMTNL